MKRMRQDGDAIVQVDEDRELSEREKLVLHEFVRGEHADNGTRSYQKIFPNANYNTASVAASQLLKLPSAERFLAEIHAAAIGTTAGELKQWVDLLPMAQAVIVATAQGRMRNRLAYEASVYLVNRTLGAPTASTQVTVRDEAAIIRAMAAYARRAAEGSKQRMVNGDDG